jgi:hypothetical protein
LPPAPRRVLLRPMVFALRSQQSDRERATRRSFQQIPIATALEVPPGWKIWPLVKTSDTSASLEHASGPGASSPQVEVEMICIAADAA